MDRGLQNLLAIHDGNRHFAVLVAFMTLGFMLGGGARADIISLVVLRPAAVAVIVYALLNGAHEKCAPIRAILTLLVLLTILLIFQLIPLPPSVWPHLPGRAVISEIDRAAGLIDLWRPLSLSPGRTMNSLLSLSIPFAALLLLTLLTPFQRYQLLQIICVFAFVSATLGVMQLVGDKNSIFYFYNVTNKGGAVGLFANRNHNAILIAIAIPIVLLTFDQSVRMMSTSMWRVFCSVSLMALPFTLLIIGSRGGLILGGFSLILCLCIYFVGVRKDRNEKSALMYQWKRWPALIATLSGVIGALILITSWLGRATAIDRLFSYDPQAEARYKLTPAIIEMADINFPFGTGFGAFEAAFYQYEPKASINGPYMNHAHNDWLEIVVEGGLFGAAILLAFLIVFAQSIYKQWQKRKEGANLYRMKLYIYVSLIMLGLASLPDYPLRVPSLMVVFVILSSVTLAPPGWFSPSTHIATQRSAHK